MKRILLFIVGLIIIISALTFFTYSVDSLAQEAPTVTPGTASQSGTPDTQSTTTPVTSETGTVATPAVVNAAPEKVSQTVASVEIPVPKEPVTRNPSNPGSEQAAQYAKMTEHTALEAPHAAEIPEPADPQAEHTTSQSFDESLGITHEPVVEPKASESEPHETEEMPDEIQPAKSAGVPSCIVLCDKVCNTLKDETEKLIEE